MSWLYYESLILSKPPHEDIVVPCSSVSTPEIDGYSITILAEGQGQDVDYEKRFPDGKRIHIRKYNDVYRAHWDLFSPIINPIQHLRYDAPHWWVTLCVIGAAALGTDNSDEGESDMLVRGVLGFFFGLLTLPKD